MRTLLVIGLLALPTSAALAYDGFSPLSGPNTVVPSPVCEIVNFGFCPQPPVPAPMAYDPNEITPRRAVLPPPPAHRRARRAARPETVDVD